MLFFKPFGEYCWPVLIYRMETELLVRQHVERDLSDLRKVIDDTQLSKMQLESQIEAVKEELAYLKKDHRDVS